MKSIGSRLRRWHERWQEHKSDQILVFGMIGSRELVKGSTNLSNENRIKELIERLSQNWIEEDSGYSGRIEEEVVFLCYF